MKSRIRVTSQVNYFGAIYTKYESCLYKNTKLINIIDPGSILYLNLLHDI